MSASCRDGSVAGHGVAQYLTQHFFLPAETTLTPHNLLARLLVSSGAPGEKKSFFFSGQGRAATSREAGAAMLLRLVPRALGREQPGERRAASFRGEVAARAAEATLLLCSLHSGGGGVSFCGQ